MNNPIPLKPERRKPIIKYTMMSFYFLFIGFCAMGIYLKWDALSNQRTYDYEEGFGVSARVPDMDKGPSFLERLTRRNRPKEPPVKLPQRNERALQTWQKYAAPIVTVPQGNVTVILVIDDLGIVKRTTKEMIDMDVPLTLAFLPYASDISSQVNDAYNNGHDVLVHIPMEPKGKADPGPHALLSSTEPSVQMDSINYNLTQFENYVGINNHMDSKFTEDEEAVERLLNVVKQKGLLVLDSKTTSNSVLVSLADQNEIPVINRDVFLDNTNEVDYILGQLKELEQKAKKNGNAVGIGHPYPETVIALKRWIPTLKEKDITIVPISQTVSKKYAKTILAAD